MFLKNFQKKFLPSKSWKNHPQKLLRIPQIYFFLLTALTAQTAQTEELMFQNVAYRPTVYRTGVNSYELTHTYSNHVAWEEKEDKVGWEIFQHQNRTSRQSRRITKDYSTPWHDKVVIEFLWYFVTKIVLTFTVRKNCSSDRKKLLKFEAEGPEFAKILRSLEQFI